MIAELQKLDFDGLTGQNPEPEDLHTLYTLCCTFKEILRDFLETQGLYNCLLADKLATVVCPSPGPNPEPTAYIGEWKTKIQQLVALAGEFFRYCLCSALLPPCPEPAMDNCVPLATITVQRADCHIVRVCNWGPRKFVTTFPNLGYWLSWLPFTRLLHDLIKQVCCQPLQQKTIGVGIRAEQSTQPPSSPPGAVPGTAPGTSEPSNIGGIAMTPPLTQLFRDSLTPKNRGRSIDVQTLVLGISARAAPTTNCSCHNWSSIIQLSFCCSIRSLPRCLRTSSLTRFPGLSTP